jgi:uncharacterized protein
VLQIQPFRIGKFCCGLFSKYDFTPVVESRERIGLPVIAMKTGCRFLNCLGARILRLKAGGPVSAIGGHPSESFHLKGKIELNRPAQSLSKPLTKSVAGIVTACSRYRWTVLAVAMVVTFASAYYAASHFQINTRTRNFISSNVPWRQDMIKMDRTFPQGVDQIVVVIDGKTMELAEAAVQRLAEKLQSRPELYQSVERQNGGPFFDRNALLFMPLAETQHTTEELSKARPILVALATDPSLRGIMNVYSVISRGVVKKTGALDGFDRPITALADTLDDLLSGRRAFFSWRSLLTGETPSLLELRQIISVKPILDYEALQPGKIPTAFIRNTARDVGLTPENGVRVRLTGPVPLADEEYSAIEEGATLNRVATGLVVLFILWRALKSPRIVLAVALCVVAGLAMTAAAGLKLVGAFNLISLAFGVLFIGIGTDFAIQFSVRYRAERAEEPDFDKAMSRAANKIGRPLALAAAATAAGFYSFLPTDYVGVKELGLVAGTGMFIAFFTTLTVLPALLSIFGSPREKESVGFKFLAPVDHFMSRHRFAIILGTLAVALAGTPLLSRLQFDWNPLDLSPQNAEAVVTLRDLTKSPETNPNTITINILSRSLADAQPVAERLRQLPQVARVTTLQNFVPEDQDAKLAIIDQAARLLKPVLDANRHAVPPSDAEDIAAMRRAAQALIQAAALANGKGADARRLAQLMGNWLRHRRSSGRKRGKRCSPALRQRSIFYGPPWRHKR